VVPGTWAVDVDLDMVEVGRAKAARIGTDNVRWTLGRAEDLRAPPSSFELITIGNAFHRLDRGPIAARTPNWLAPGGALAIPNTGSVWAGNEPWQAIAVEVIHGWTDAADRPSTPTNAGRRRRSTRPS
jgi:hypothetical protein